MATETEQETTAGAAEQNGRSVAEIAAENERRAANGDEVTSPEIDEEEDTGQFQIAGFSTGLTNTVGGRKPDVSQAKVASIALAVSGEFKAGDKLRAVVDLVCTDIRFKDERDRKSGAVERRRRIHTFDPVAIQVQPMPPGEG